MQDKRKMASLLVIGLLVGVYQQVGAGNPRPCMPSSVCAYESKMKHISQHQQGDGPDIVKLPTPLPR